MPLHADPYMTNLTTDIDPAKNIAALASLPPELRAAAQEEAAEVPESQEEEEPRRAAAAGEAARCRLGACAPACMRTCCRGWETCILEVPCLTESELAARQAAAVLHRPRAPLAGLPSQPPRL